MIVEMVPRWCRPVKESNSAEIIQASRLYGGKPATRVQIPPGAPRDIMPADVEEELERKLQKKFKEKKYRAVYRKAHKKKR